VLPLLGAGISADRLLIDEASRNTYENARFTARLLQSQPAGRWLLITSASHMPRAIGTFRKNGIDVDAWPIFDMAGPGAPVDEVARRETLGLLGYWTLGRSSELFPSRRHRPSARAIIPRGAPQNAARAISPTG
jgi:uncharacterized SAM-binding protein YcdF (DUF218 family)